MTGAGWVETYRGVVYRWELDHNDHLTVAYYFQRFGDAGSVLLEALGLGRGRFAGADLYVRYLSEFRGGDLLHIESGVLHVTADGLVAAHRVVNSETGRVAATVEHRFAAVGTPLTDAERDALAARRVAWDGEPRVRRPRPAASDGAAPSGRDTIRPSDLDAEGRLGLAAYIHRFSAANGHAVARFGLTPGYQQTARRGFSTFEFQFACAPAADVRPGDVVRVTSALVHVGTSSMRLLHRMASERTGEELASLEQFGVHLDMDARRPAPLPDALRARALGLVVPTPPRTEEQ